MFAYFLFLFTITSIVVTVSLQSCDQVCCKENNITECYLDGSGLDGLSNISNEVNILHFTGNNITILDKSYFMNFTYLQELYVERNNIATVHKSAFIGLASLTHLSLAKNKIKSLEKNTFKFCSNLKFLNLSYNSIRKLENITVALKQMNITRLILTDLKSLNNISKSDFIPLISSNLKELDVSWCKIHNIENGSFSTLTNLEILKLKGNEVEQLSYAFYNISSKLKQLDLSYMKLTAVPEESLQLLSATKLQHLNIGGNVLKRLFEFPYLPFVETLDLQYCQLRSLFTKSLWNLPNLKELYLGHNELRNIDIATSVLHHNGWAHKFNLTHLHLNSNKLSCRFKHYYLQHMSSLIHFDLSYNCLCDISRIFSNKDLPNLQYLDLKRNGIKPWIYDLKLKNLRTLYLENNSIDIITNEMMEVFQKLDILDVSSNPFKCTQCVVAQGFASFLNNTNNTEIKNKENVKCEYPNDLWDKEVIYAPIPKYCLTEPDYSLYIIIGIFGAFCFIVATFYYFKWYICYYWWYCFASKDNNNENCDSAYTLHCDSITEWVVEEMKANLDKLGPSLRIKCTGERPGWADIFQDFGDALKNSRRIIVILTNEFLKDNLCKRLLEFADAYFIEANCRKGMIFIVYEDISRENMTDWMKLLIRTRVCLKYKNSKEFWARLKHQLEIKEKPVPEEERTALLASI